MKPPTPPPASGGGGAPGAADPLHAFADRLAPELEHTVAQLDDATERARAFVRTHPGAVLFGAALLGFAIGRWASRR